MLYWVFDLDQTLYQLNSNEFSYHLLKKDKQLEYLLSCLPSSKIIFTNGTLNHANISLKKIGISKKFVNIDARDTLDGLKPAYSVFAKFIKSNSIRYKDKCVFFDDLPDNLISSKRFNWITVLINRNNYVHESIDFWFPNIYVALNFFLSKIQNNLDK